MTSDHHTFWYFTTTQCPGLASQHLSIISWFGNYHFHSWIASLFTEAVFSRRQGLTMLCPQLGIHNSHIQTPSQLKSHDDPQGLPGPAIPNLNLSIHPRFSAYWLYCYSIFSAFQRGWGSWKPHLLQMTYSLWHAEQTGSWGAKGKVFMEDLL